MVSVQTERDKVHMIVFMRVNFISLPLILATCIFPRPFIQNTFIEPTVVYIVLSYLFCISWVYILVHSLHSSVICTWAAGSVKSYLHYMNSLPWLLIETTTNLLQSPESRNCQQWRGGKIQVFKRYFYSELPLKNTCKRMSRRINYSNTNYLLFVDAETFRCTWIDNFISWVNLWYFTS